jgi:hypothetical protein
MCDHPTATPLRFTSQRGSRRHSDRRSALPQDDIAPWKTHFVLPLPILPRRCGDGFRSSGLDAFVGSSPDSPTTHSRETASLPAVYRTRHISMTCADSGRIVGLLAATNCRYSTESEALSLAPKIDFPRGLDRFAVMPSQHCCASVTRQITSPTSSATSREPSGPMVTPTGRP